MKLLIFGFLIISLVTLIKAEKKIVCYHGTWSTYRHGNGKFDVKDIDPTLCTHLIYTFFGIKSTGEFRIIDPYLDLEENWGRGNIKQFNQLKEINPKLKTLAAVGGWNEGSRKFSEVAKSSEKRQIFIKTSIEFILKYGFDGLDLDWEYPAQRDGDRSVDKENYVIFVKELKQELKKHNLLLTAAVGSVEYSAEVSYNIREVSKYLDFINVMVYDLHGKWDKTIGINAPLFEGPADITEKEKQLNVKASIEYWLKEGCPAEKLILGVPFYGRTFTLQYSEKVEPGSPHNGAGQAGKYTNEPGMIGYNELCEQFKTENWLLKWEGIQKVPYAVRGNQWIGYDNAKSIELKAQFANQYKLGGVMVWSVETDDFHGICGEKYPLLKRINKVLGNGAVLPPTTPTTRAPTKPTSTVTTSAPTKPTSTPTKPTSVPTKPTSTSSTRPSTSKPEPSTSTPRPSTYPPSSTTKKPPSDEFECKPNQDGTFRDPKDCSVFYMCVHGQKNSFKCPKPLNFDLKILACNYPHLVDCN